MAMKVRNNGITSSRTRFSSAPMAELEFSTLVDNPRLLTTLNAGDIVPVYCAEVLPHDTISMDLDFVLRQSTLAVPVMGELVIDYYAFFAQNRVLNKSWKNVMGENSSGSWTSPDVSLVPLHPVGAPSVTVPVGSVADYYGIPTQRSISSTILSQMNDFRFRGYLEIYNTYFRDQNYMPPIPYSKLNVFNGFMYSSGTEVSVSPVNGSGNTYIDPNLGIFSDGSSPRGAILKEIYGDGSSNEDYNNMSQRMTIPARRTNWSALDKPLKACKLHDYFTSVLPSPQKGRSVSLPIDGIVPLDTSNAVTFFSSGEHLQFTPEGGVNFGGHRNLVVSDDWVVDVDNSNVDDDSTRVAPISATNMVADLSQAAVSITVNDLRMSSAMQRVFEILGNGGSRYVEFVNSFFGIEVDNPFDDIPILLGHFRRDLDFFQTAQTSASPSAEDAGTPQGNLAAFGLTNKDGKLFTKTFNEHGYIHVLAVVRHRNVYTSMIDRDFFRMNMLDYYQYPLANIGEQPVYTRQINPFIDASADGVFGYQEAWAEYRYEPDRCSGYMRSGITESLDVWNYADDFNPSLVVANDDFMRSNTADVIARSTALTEREYPQFKLLVNFHIKKERALPVYSVPGADIF